MVSYLFALTFDARVLRVIAITGTPPFTPLVANPAAFPSGTVRFAANNPTFAPAHGVIEVANITFVVIGGAGSQSDIMLQTPAEGMVVVGLDTNGDGRFDSFQPLPPSELSLGSRTIVVQ